jgi:hypothetical protein
LIVDFGLDFVFKAYLASTYTSFMAKSIPFGIGRGFVSSFIYQAILGILMLEENIARMPSGS